MRGEFNTLGKRYPKNLWQALLRRLWTLVLLFKISKYNFTDSLKLAAYTISKLFTNATNVAYSLSKKKGNILWETDENQSQRDFQYECSLY